MRPGHGIPSTCELCDLLGEVLDYNPSAMLTQPVDPHHIFGRRLDDPCNVVTACRNCHEWCTDRDKESRLVGTYVLAGKRRFDRERIRESWGRDPISYIEACHNEGWFEHDLHLDAIATTLLERF